MRVMIVLLSAFSLFIGYRLYLVETEIAQLQRNTAIAVLSAEAVNNKIGAIAPYFSPDKEAFVRAWLDSTNMPLAIFPEEVLVPLKQELERKRSDPISRKTVEATFRSRVRAAAEPGR